MPADSMAIPVAPGFKRVRLGDIVSRRAEPGLAGLPTASVTMNHGLVARNANERRVVTTLLPSQHLLARKGDIAYNMMRMWQGACGLAHEDCLISPAYIVLRPHEEICPAFVFYMFKSPEMIAQFHRNSRGLTNDRLRLYYDEFQRIETSVPETYSDQAAIAIALNSADDNISYVDNTIAKIRKVLTGSFNDLLKGGIDARGVIRNQESHPEKFTDSLLGSIPTDWQVCGLEQVFDITSGFTLGDHRRPHKNPRKYLRVANVRRGSIDMTELLELEASDAEMLDMRLKVGDLLIVEGHASPDEIGRCAEVGMNAAGLTFQNHLFRLRGQRILPSFGAAWLNSQWTQTYWRRLCGTSSGLNTINRTMLKAVLVPIPPPDEQQRIVNAAHDMVRRLRAEESYRDKLKLQKRGLMHDLLTGRVRG